MLEGSCRCGGARWRFDGEPQGATACNCTTCRRYGALWIYGHEGEDVHVGGPVTDYSPGRALDFQFCPTCGCVVAWRGRTVWEGRRRLAVNVRLAEPEAVAGIPIDRFDGLGGFTDLPRDGRCVGDYWF